jgi:hypothetical protein
MSQNDDVPGIARPSPEVRDALREWRRAALAVATTAEDHEHFDVVLAARDEAHARYVEVLNKSLRERLARDEESPRRVSDDMLIGDPEG